MKQARLGGIPLPGSDDNNGVATIGSVKIDTTKPLAALLGFIVTMQYDVTAASGCFYVIVDTVNSLNYIVATFKDIKNTLNIYDLVVYNSLHIYSNTIACYE